MNRTGQIATGLVLTALAGYVDARGFIRLGGLYTSFMSGNTTQLAILVPARWTTPTVLAYEGLLIVGGLALGLQAPELAVASVFVALAMGGRNAVLAQVKGFRAGTTFLTGALFSFGQKIAQALTRTGDPLGWVGDGLVWLSLLAGAVFGALAYDALGLYALIPPAGVAGTLALVIATLVVCAGPPAAKV